MTEHRPDIKGGQASILVVDDDASIRDILCLGLKMAQCTCFSAESGAQALDILENHYVDVVITDIRMDGMSGTDLCRIVKKRTTSDVIIITGLVEDFTYEEIIEWGASDFIEKPLRMAEVIARLKRVLLQRATSEERNRAVQALKLNLDKSQRAMEGFVQAISLSVEMRDPYTAGHQLRVAELASAIAEEMAMEESRIYGLKMAAKIHDLGKITIPSEILCKPGGLTPLEYELIKSHVQSGYDILKKIEFPWPIADIILQHHERLDGSGYPNGLKGDRIMTEAKIISVADVFETIASHRPYRPSLGTHSALEELRNKAGSIYDPDIAAICIQLVKEKKFRFENVSNKSTFVTDQMQAI